MKEFILSLILLLGPLASKYDAGDCVAYVNAKPNEGYFIVEDLDNHEYVTLSFKTEPSSLGLYYLWGRNPIDPKASRKIMCPEFDFISEEAYERLKLFNLHERVDKLLEEVEDEREY